MGMSVQKKFLCGFTFFVLLIGLVGFLIGFFARPYVDNASCSGAKNGNDDTSGMLAYEKEALELVLAQRIRHYLKIFTNHSLIVGTNRTCSQAQYIKDEWNSIGLDTVEIKHYDVLLSYPKRPSEVSLVDKTGTVVYTSVLTQKNLNVLDGASRNISLFSAYSASGIATGKLLYINYGRDNDFEFLQARNISCAGKMVLLRYGKILESAKVANAQKWNAAGVLLYSDPADYANNATNDTLTDVTWYSSSTAPGGGSWVNEGGLLTPGYPATTGIYRELVDNVPRSKIPVQPIPRGEAETLLRILNKTSVPNTWQGGLSLSYGIEMDPSDTRNVTLNVNVSVFEQPVCNVVGTIKGRTEPDRYVLLGSPRPSGGTPILMEVVRVLKFIQKKGWMPRRTIKFCSWGSGYIGSVEWIEEYERVLETRAVAYLNLDSGIQGKFNMRLKSNPLLEETALEAAKQVRHPDSQSETLYDEWKRPNHDKNFLSIDSESGCLSFGYKIGVPCVHVTYHPYNVSGRYMINHPLYDKYNVALAQVWLQMTFNIAGSLYIPFDVVRYANALCAFAGNLSATYNGTLKVNNITLECLLKAAVDFQAAAKIYQDCLDAVDKTDVLQVRMTNDRLLQLDRAFINKEGLPGMPFVRHVVLAPSYFTTETNSKFPGITESILTAKDSGNGNDWERVKKQISIAVHAFRSAVSILQPPDF